MKNLPNLFKNKINKSVSNNMKVFYTNTYNNEFNDIDKKLNELFERHGYIYNLEVSIKTNDETFNTRLAGKIKNYLITLDNKIIPIRDIVEIDEKK